MLKKMLFPALFALALNLSAQTVLPVQENLPTPPRFGYFSYNAIFKAMPEYAAAQENLNLLKAKYDAEIKRAENEFNEKYAEFLQDQKNFPEAILLRRQKELQQLMEKSIEFKNEIKELLNKARHEMTDPVRERLSKVINAIGLSHGFEYILNTDNNSYPYINTQVGLDITPEIKNRLGIADEPVQQ